MKNEYLYSSIYKTVDDFILDSNSTYIYGYSTEERSHIDYHLKAQIIKNTNFIQIEEIRKDVIKEVNSENEYFLKSPSQISKLIQKYSVSNLYIDVTGLDNRICASLIKNAIESYQSGIFKSIKVIYAEPLKYNIRSFKAESVFNDLSEQIDGIEPLPGFASIFPEDNADVFLVALLGFEGGRFTHMLENVQPSRDKIIPIIGVPGFRLEYPFVAYWGNRRPLEDTDSWRQVKFAAANSLVDIYMLLNKIIRKNPNFKIKLAPIGTKPHAIGAMLFAIKYPMQVELVYDNPIRKMSRSTGIGNVIECQVSKLISEN